MEETGYIVEHRMIHLVYYLATYALLEISVAAVS